MAEAAVGFLLENLMQLLEHEIGVLESAKREVEFLSNELRLIKAVLEDCEKLRNREICEDMVNEIRDVAYEAEDILDSYICQRAEYKSRSFISKWLGSSDYRRSRFGLADEIRSIRGKVKKLSESQALCFKSLEFGVRSESGQVQLETKVPKKVREDSLVGFEDEKEKITSYLIGGSDELQVISIIGIGGLGKTTLARSIYNDPRVEDEFDFRAWITVSQDYSCIHDLLRSMSSSFIQPTDSTDDEALAQELRGFLSKRKYLIVVDDVWHKEAWDVLQTAFPRNPNGSRILLTSRIKEVGCYVNPTRHPHEMRSLNLDESWRLLQRKALGAENCPPELTKHGLHIAKQCMGLPLALVLMGGILSGNQDVDWWEGIAENQIAHGSEDPIERVLHLSYHNLPCNLRPCFLYLALFPINSEISASKMARLWIAEGFILHEAARSLEEIAEDCIEDLIHRSFLSVRKLRSNDKVKTFSVLRPVHEFCTRKALGECFYQETGRLDRGNSLPSYPPSEEYRRLSVHSQVLDFISSKKVGPKVRTLLTSSTQKTVLPAEHESSIPKAFKLLRVLDARSIVFARFPVSLSQLVMLRYITISGNFTILPAALSSLWNLQTLFVETSSRMLEIKADVWKFIRLRHVKTNAAMTLPGRRSRTRKIKDEKCMVRSVRRLSMISPDSCTESVFAMLPHLKTLGIRGRLSKLLENKRGYLSFARLEKLVHLEELKLMNDVFPRPPREGKLVRLPQSGQFPPGLRKLTLSSTWLDWKEMSKLAMLENLEVLKLKDNAFMGEQWRVPDDVVFRALRVLLVGRTDLVTWQASAHHLPRLERLFISYCTNLREIPPGFADISNLRSMDLQCTTQSVVASAVAIRQNKMMVQQYAHSNGDTRFVLSVLSQDY